jgi:acyl-CoA thioesterase FadM
MTSHQDPNLIWREEYTIRSYEADAQGKATMPLLCRFMQESASNHAEHLGFGISWLAENDFAWFLTRQLIVMDVYPGLGETIQLLTWPKGRDRLLWYRDFKVLDSSESTIGRAVTAWLVIDLDKRRPRRADTLPPLHPPNDVEPALSRHPGKVAALSESTLEVNYLAEALYGDEVSANCEDTDGQTFLHSLVRDADGSELFRARTHWVSMR